MDSQVEQKFEQEVGTVVGKPKRKLSKKQVKARLNAGAKGVGKKRQVMCQQLLKQVLLNGSQKNW